MILPPLTACSYFDHRAMIARYAAPIEAFASRAAEITASSPDLEKYGARIAGLGRECGLQIHHQDNNRSSGECATVINYHTQSGYFPITSIRKDDAHSASQDIQASCSAFNRINPAKINWRSPDMNRRAMISMIATDLARRDAAGEGRAFIAIDKMALRILSAFSPQSLTQQSRLDLRGTCIHSLANAKSETRDWITENLAQIGASATSGLTIRDGHFPRGVLPALTEWEVSLGRELVTAVSRPAKNRPNSRWAETNLTINGSLPEASILQATGQHLYEVVDHPLFASVDLVIICASNKNGRCQIDTNAHDPAALIVAEYHREICDA